MLPRNIVAIGSQLEVLRKFQRIAPNAALSVEDKSGGAALRLAERDYDRLFENCIDVIEDLLRESGDIARDSRLKLLGKQISRTDLLLGEIGPGPDEEFRRLVIVEDKLSTNRECRRDVLAQILEYDHSVQTSLSLDDLPDNVSDWVEDYRDDIRRGMRTGDFLLIICGDAIDRSLMNLVRSYVDRLDPSNLSDLVLIEMAIFSDGETHVLVPYVAAGTERAVRDLTVRVEIQAANGVPLEIGKIRADETPEEGRRRPRRERVVIPPEIFMKEWEEACGPDATKDWRTFVEAVDRSAVVGLEWSNYPGGAPYLYLSNTSVGSVGVLRLTDKKPIVRDLMNRSIWNSDQKAREARQTFRKALLDQVPGAALSGVGGEDDHPKRAKRVIASVKAVADQRDAVIKAISNLAAELRARADS